MSYRWSGGQRCTDHECLFDEKQEIGSHVVLRVFLVPRVPFGLNPRRGDLYRVELLGDGEHRLATGRSQEDPDVSFTFAFNDYLFVEVGIANFNSLLLVKSHASGQAPVLEQRDCGSRAVEREFVDVSP